MNVANHLAAYGAALVVFLAMDAVWLKFVAYDMYQRGIGHLLAPQVNLFAGGLFYLLYPIPLVILVVAPQAGNGWVKTAVMGALLGATAYATYELTNLATLRDWPVALSVADVLWGSFASAAAAVAGRAAWVAISR